ncbi:MAG: putative bifunctional diguanylate cyclase/phosphodiesterase, partial [Solirubrobacteraceae bacterium]
MPRPPHRPFVAAVSVAGLALLGAIAATGAADVLDRADALLVVLALAILVAELFPVELPDDVGEVSFSTTFAFALLLTDGVAAVVLVHALTLALADAVRRRPLERLVFNVAQYAICWAAAGALLTAFTGDLPDRDGLQYLELAWIPALVASALLFLVLNTAMASAPPALSRGVSPLEAMRGDLGMNAWWTVVMTALVPVILVAADYDLWLVPLLGLPLVAIQLGSRQAVINDYEARHDRITGLPNREHLSRAVEAAVDRCGRRGERVGVLLVGLNRFKELNDTLGHRRGDLMLVEVGRRLAALGRPRAEVARLGGDEFAIVLAPVGGAEACAGVAEEVIAALREPVTIRGVALDIGASVGIACHPEHGASVDALLRHADVALDRAKASHRAWVVYEPGSDERGQEQLALVADLRRAIDDGELVLLFQPQVELATGRLRGVEALLRWHHPERGVLSPEDFIEPAEHTGLIRPLTLWVIRSALAQTDRWRADGLALPVAVNLSVRAITPQLPGNLAGIVDGRPGGLELEITETVGMEDADAALAVLEQLTTLGIRLSVDDFGTGFSSLAYLKRLPVSAIKIDRSFVIDMGHDADDRAIVRSTIDLARHLGMEAVAEGVETVDALRELRALGCDLAQG